MLGWSPHLQSPPIRILFLPGKIDIFLPILFFLSQMFIENLLCVKPVLGILS